MMNMNPVPNEKEVEELRHAILEKISKLPEETFHPADIQRVKNDDFWLKRFLAHTESNQKNAIEMMMSSLKFRKESGANDVNERVKTDILAEGGFFPRGKDIDGAILLIFKCKRYVKNMIDTNDLKNCVIYWMERLERESKGKPITLFFDMEGCGLSNMDLEFTRYLIGLFKDYYPYFLNYVLVFEMPWVLSAAFKIIKSWLPEKAVRKIKFVSKKDLKDWVPLDQALACWGGKDDYVFSFVPEDDVKSDHINFNNNNNRKVRFDENTTAQMSEQSSTTTVKSVEDGALLSVFPEGTIRFTKDQDDYLSILTLKNVSSNPVAYKVKTTAPEKFRVRPGYGCLAPNAETTVTVCLLNAYKMSYVGKDKFLIMSAVVDNSNLGNDELSQLWKNLSVKKEHQIHLRCAPLTSSMSTNESQVQQFQQNGNVGTDINGDNPSTKSLVETIKEMTMAQKKHNENVKTILYIHSASIIVLIGIFLYFVSFSSMLKAGFEQ